jgi:hypothetical protein
MSHSGPGGRESREKQDKSLNMKNSDQSQGHFPCRFRKGNPGNLSELFFPGQESTLFFIKVFASLDIRSIVGAR